MIFNFIKIFEDFNIFIILRSKKSVMNDMEYSLFFRFDNYKFEKVVLFFLES